MPLTAYVELTTPKTLELNLDPAPLRRGSAFLGGQDCVSPTTTCNGSVSRVVSSHPYDRRACFGPSPPPPRQEPTAQADQHDDPTHHTGAHPKPPSQPHDDGDGVRPAAGHLPKRWDACGPNRNDGQDHQADRCRDSTRWPSRFSRRVGQGHGIARSAESQPESRPPSIDAPHPKVAGIGRKELFRGQLGQCVRKAQTLCSLRVPPLERFKFPPHVLIRFRSFRKG